MKKKVNIFLSLILIICACLTFYACDETKDTFRVKAEVWYENYGISYGSGIYEEGSEVVITATPKNGSRFLAWTKNSVVVSYDAEYKFPANNETSGTYIAIFTYPKMDRVNVLDVTYSNSAYFSEDEKPRTTAIINIGDSYDHFYKYMTVEDEVTTKENIVFALDANSKIYAEVILTFTYTVVIEEEPTEITQTTKTYLEIELDIDNNVYESNSKQLTIVDGMSGEATVVVKFETFDIKEEVAE